MAQTHRKQATTMESTGKQHQTEPSIYGNDQTTPNNLLSLQALQATTTLPYLKGFWADHQAVLLQALQKLACIHLYIKSFTVHTEVSLTCLQEHITAYGELMEVNIFDCRRT
jgi:hypothetical protein